MSSSYLGGASVVLGAGVGEFVADESLVDRQDREWVDLLVGAGQISPAVVAVGIGLVEDHGDATLLGEGWQMEVELKELLAVELRNTCSVGQRRRVVEEGLAAKHIRDVLRNGEIAVASVWKDTS